MGGHRCSLERVVIAADFHRSATGAILSGAKRTPKIRRIRNGGSRETRAGNWGFLHGAENFVEMEKIRFHSLTALVIIYQNSLFRSGVPFSLSLPRIVHEVYLCVSIPLWQSIGIHPNRTARGDRNHCDPDRATTAGGPEGPRGSRTHEVQQQLEAMGTGDSQLRRHIP